MLVLGVFLTQASRSVFVPLTVGGGIRGFKDANGTTYSALEVASSYFRSAGSGLCKMRELTFSFLPLSIRDGKERSRWSICLLKRFLHMDSKLRKCGTFRFESVDVLFNIKGQESAQFDACILPCTALRGSCDKAEAQRV